VRPELAARLAIREDLLATLRGVLIDRMRLRREPVEIDPDTPLFGDGFGLDSLDAVELVVALDTLFGITLADNDQLRAQMRTLNTVIDLVVAHREGTLDVAR
jgi:acyl carrier protein